MFKKSFFFFVFFMVLATSVYFLAIPNKVTNCSVYECPFCQPSIIEHQAFYEDNLVLAMCTHKPIMPGHCLIIPKRHVERFEATSDEEAAQICKIIKKVDQAVSKVFGTSAYLLLQKNGREAGQTVPHVHFHYIPRKTGDCSVIKFLFKMFFVNAQGPISPVEIEDTVEKLKKAME